MKKLLGHRYTGRRLKKSWKDLAYKAFITMVIMLVIITAFDGLELYQRFCPKVTEGQLVRQISEVLNYLPEAPENFEAQKFAPQLPKIVKEDIKQMTRSEDIDKVVYENKDGTVNLTLEMVGNELVITKQAQDQWYSFAEKIFGDIAIYRENDKILVYGQYIPNERTMAYFEVTEDYAFDSVWNKSIDLLGVDKDSYETYECGSSVTMIREGRNFSFYRYGEQVGETTTFPGAEILEIREGYILDSSNTLYYAYYCANSDEPWVQFVKVADKVDRISDVNVMVKGYVDDYPRWFCPYEKEGKLYLAVPDMGTLEVYGIFSSGSHEKGVCNPRFAYETVEISDENAYTMFIYKTEYGTAWMTQKLYYNPKGYMVYTEERISGIDTYVSDKIPEDMLKKFDNLYVFPADYQKVVTELKALYEQYY